MGEAARQTILVMEDQFLIALEISEVIEDMGMEARTVAHLRDAIPALDGVRAAILDFSLHDGDTAEFAELLREREIPFAFCTGTAVREVEAMFPDVTIVGKPFGRAELERALASLLGGATRAAAGTIPPSASLQG